MTKIVADYPDLHFSSLPHLAQTPYIELSLRGNHARIEPAMAFLKSAIEQAGLVWSTQLIDNQ